MPAIRGVAFFLVLLLPARSPAGGFTIIELGAKKTGMMTGLAKPDDLSGVYHNPAGIAGLRGTRLHLSSGFSLVDASIRLKAWESVDPQNPDHRPARGDGFYGSEDYIDTRVDREGYFAGTIKPTRYFGAMPMLVASSDFGREGGPVFALSVYVPDFIGAFLPEDAPTRYAVVEGYFTAAVAAVTAAYRLPPPLDWLDLGASAGLLYVRMEGKQWQNFPVLFDYNADIIIRMAGEDYRFYYNAGVCARPVPAVTLGLVLIGGTEVELDGRLDISFPEGWEQNPYTKMLVDQEIIHEGRFGMRNRMKVPYGLGTGINWEILPELEAAFDFRYWFYRAWREQKIFHTIDFALPGSAEPRPLVESPIVIPKQYRDSWTVSLGLLGRPFPLPLELMGGWTYDRSPAPSKTKSLDFPTTDLTGFSLGARYSLLDRWRFSLTYYRYWYLKDRVDDSILVPPQNAIFEGTVDTVSIQLEVIL